MNREKLRSYLDALIAQEIPAGKLIQRAAKRFSAEMDGDDFTWDWQRFEDACEFLEGFELPDVGKPIVLAGFQRWILALIYARCEKDRPGIPATKLLMVEAARGAGKSCFAAAVLVYELVSNHKKITLDIASIGVKQAHISVGFAESFAEQVGEPLRIFKAVGQPPLKNEDTGGTLRVLVASVQKMHGGSPRICFLDEVSHIPDDVLTQAQTGRAKREDGLVWTMTTPDPDRLRPYYTDRDIAARDIMNGEPDRGVYLLAFNADDDDPVTDDYEIVAKANPGMHDIGMPRLESLEFNYRKLVTNGDANQKSAYTREHLCRFDDNTSTFVDMDDWAKCQGTPKFPADGKCFIGIDLSRGGEGVRTDVCSISLLHIANGVASMRWQHWLPDHDLEKHEKLTKNPLRRWHSEGVLKLSAGKYIDGEQITASVREIMNTWPNVVEIGIDAWTFNADLRSVWEHTYGWPIAYKGGPQQLTQACSWFQDAVRGRRILHDGDPMMQKALKNVVLRQSPAGAVRPCKNSTRDMIDPVCAGLFAISSACDNMGERQSMYEGGDIAI